MSENNKKDWLKITQFILSLFAFLFTTIAAAGFFAGGSIFRSFLGLTDQDTTFLLSFATLWSLLSFFHINSVIQTFRKPAAPDAQAIELSHSFLFASIALLIWGIFLLINQFTFLQQFFTPLLPYLTPFMIWIPISWFIEFGKRKLIPLSARKRSAALSISSSYGMMFILLFEMIVIALVIAGVLLYLSTQPQIRQWMDSFSLPQNLSQLDIHLIERYARTLLRTPIFLVIVFLLVGLVLPLIEEILKPIAIWTLHRRSISPAEGFILGLYFGAAFALVESGGMIIQLGMGSWVTSTLLRAATGLLHITCSGLVGYAYARFMQLERKISAAIPLLIAVALHGTWNTVAVLSSLGSLSAEIGMSGFFSPIWDHVFSALMVLLWLTAFSILWKMNKKLQKDLSLLSHNENNDPGVHTFELE